MGTFWMRSGTVEFDNNGIVASGALAYFYEANTTTPQPVYTTADLNVPRTNPVVADANGRWPTTHIPFGSYALTVKTAGGTTLFTDAEIPNPEPTDTSASVDANAIFQTGDTILAGKNGTRPGFVRCNGRTIGNATSSATERANADTSALFTYIYDNYANGQAAVSGGRGASAAADYAAAKSIALPDLRNAFPFGFGDMGNTDAGLMAAAPVVSGSPILAGSIIGANTHVLTLAQLAAHTHTGTTASEGAHTHTGTTATEAAHTHTGTTATVSANHTHTYSAPTHKNRSYATPGFTGDTWGGADVSTGTGIESANHTHSFTSDAGSAHSHTFTTAAGSAHTHTFTSASTGSDTAHNNAPRGVPFTFLMKL